jgi:hypothetical protein
MMSGLLAALIFTGFLAGESPGGGAPAEPAGEPPALPPPSLALPPPAAAPPPASSPSLVEPAPASAREPPPAESPSSAPPDPLPKPEARFGDEGVMAFTGALSASFGHLGYSSADSSSTSVSIQPAFDYFSGPSFSEGISALFRYTDSSSGIDITDKTLTFGVTVAAGANLWLGDRVSFWPKLSFGVWQSRSTLSAPLGGSISVNGTAFPLGPDTVITQNAAFVQLYAPFLFHVTRHFFVGFGPDGYVDIVHSANSIDNRRRFLGASSTIGGWF